MKWTNWFRRVHDLNADDLVVFVIGPTGGGKSWFINAATSKSGLVSVSDKLEPCTKDVGAVRCGLTDTAKKALKLDANSTKSIVFVDMPSFFTGHENGAEKKVTKWLENLKYASTLVGMIYVARLENNPADKPTEIQDHLKTFARTFPKCVKNPPNRLLAVLSYESKLSPKKIKDHTEQFEKQVNAITGSMSIMKGGKRKLEWRATFRRELFREAPDDLARNIAWKVVEELFF